MFEEPASRTSKDIARQAALSYVLNGHEAQIVEFGASSELPGASVVVIPSLSRLDVTADDSTKLDLVLAAVEEHRSAGWDVWTIVPLRRLAEAHEACRGKTSMVQGWWVSGGDVAFTPPQVP